MALKPSILRFPAPGALVGQNGKHKKIAQFRGETFGVARSPPKSAPSTRTLHFRVFRPGPEFLQVPKAKTGQNTTKSPFPTGGGPTEQKVVPQKVAIPDSVATFFLPKVPLAPGDCVFLFSARAWNFSKCPRPKTGQLPLNHCFRPMGVRPKKSCFRESCGKSSRIAR